MRRTEALLKAAGILVKPPDLESSDASGDDADDHVAMEENDTSDQLQCTDIEVDLSTPHEQSFNSNASSKPNERGRSNTQKGPPVYKAEKGNHLYYGIPAATLCSGTC